MKHPSEFIEIKKMCSTKKRAYGGLLLDKKYPTHYLPKVGRQVMALGGYPTESKKIPSAASQVMKTQEQRLKDLMKEVAEDEYKYE